MRPSRACLLSPVDQIKWPQTERTQLTFLAPPRLAGDPRGAGKGTAALSMRSIVARAVQVRKSRPAPVAAAAYTAGEVPACPCLRATKLATSCSSSDELSVARAFGSQQDSWSAR